MQISQKYLKMSNNFYNGVSLKTRVLKTEQSSEAITEAAKLLRDGQVVAFPTETVYGLGANALSETAVAKIFEAKGRPQDNPLIVHISKFEQINYLVRSLPDEALILAEKFWPGPLTLVLPASDVVPQIVTAGLKTVGIRMPDHKVALDILNECELPIAAPSANISGRPSPTTAMHVLEDLDGKIPLIVDGGAASVGIESTVLDLSGKIPVILRPGGVTFEKLKEILGNVLIDKSVMNFLEDDEIPASPGMKHMHYAPIAQMIVVRGDCENVKQRIKELSQEYIKQGKKVGVLATAETIGQYSDGCEIISVGTRLRPESIAANLFASLRHFDRLLVDVILAEGIDTENEGLAVMNRMLRASGFCLIDV